jgi:hypothetical protein
MDHLNARIKPSIVIVLLIEYGNEVYSWTPAKLKEVHDAMLKQVKTVSKLKEAYRGAKGAQHGTNYGMQPPLMASLQLQTAVKSWVANFNDGIVEEIDFKQVHPHVMARYQNLYSEYYGIEKRNDWLRTQLSNCGYLDCANGHRRKFMSIRNRKNIDDATVRIAASHEPQANTTYATNVALCNMYFDRTNRTPKGNLRVEPLLMSHDALAGQNHKSQHTYIAEKIQEWFNVPLIIHGIPVTIPVEGGFGKNWKNTDS